MKREVRRIHWYTAEKEKTNDTKVIKDQTYCIFYNLSDLSTNNTISLGEASHIDFFHEKRHMFVWGWGWGGGGGGLQL